MITLFPKAIAAGPSAVNGDNVSELTTMENTSSSSDADSAPPLEVHMHLERSNDASIWADPGSPPIAAAAAALPTILKPAALRDAANNTGNGDGKIEEGTDVGDSDDGAAVDTGWSGDGDATTLPQ